MAIEKYIIDKSDLPALLRGEDLKIQPKGNIKGICVEIAGNPTNGDMIKAMFPNGKEYDNDGDVRYEIEIDFDYSYCSYFDGVWWNAPYKADKRKTMTREEVIKQLKKLKSFHNGSYGEAINFAIESIKVDMAYDLAYEKAESESNMTNNEAIETLKVAKSEIEWEYPMNYQIALDKAIKALEQEPYKDFCEFVAKMVLRDDFEENVGANSEFLCRKLSKLGIVKADKDEWVLVESEDENA